MVEIITTILTEETGISKKMVQLITNAGTSEIPECQLWDFLFCHVKLTAEN